MPQGVLFDDDGQATNLERVRAKLADAILAFCRQRLERGQAEFHAGELLAFVEARVMGLAPDSPSRILRLLRRERKVDYTVVSRKDSLYRVMQVF